MSIINSYKPPALQELTEPAPGPFDVYFNGPVPERLESPRVRLVPYIPSVHSKAFFNEYQKSPEIEKYLPVSWPDYPTFLTWMQNHVLSDPKALVLAIIDRTKGNDGENIEESIAGLIGYLNCAPRNLSVEIGPVIILPRSQRTFVSSNAIGLVLKYALDLPRDGGNGYRRVTWCADPNNKASVRAAERMGFKIEGEMRWTWILPVGKDGGLLPVDGMRREGEGRNSTLLSMCWDDWEAGAKEHVEKMMERV
ncbi:hypothetical protein EST38_g308 [Candolleomyces aberdarensis]|uniref:N-acetyltransferase domain-containing protein n=1 Tax=Candolleomyces aberdarensis TaxID=2316362 RepID=A0A4Q2DY99_9AGAR|nr:hypothetical protein EST38_g308 [Candolleomyces aberdarensis]